MLAPTDSPQDLKHEQEASKERQLIVQEDADRTWHGVKLQPWSQERQCLLDSLCAADVPLPAADVCDHVAFYKGYFTWAVKALYLAHHVPADWERLRPRLLSIIPQWGFADYIPADLDEEERKTFTPIRSNVPGETLADKMAAVDFVFKMTTDHEKVMVVRRVKRMGVGVESGNELSL